MATALAGSPFALRLDKRDFTVTAWPAPRRIGGRIVAVSGYVADETNAEHAHQAVDRAYARDGAELSRGLLGQYAAVVVDAAARRAALVQDSLGLHDLFYAERGASLVVASDLELLLAVEPDAELDERYFALYLGAPYDDHRLTPFRGVQRLSYGWNLTLQDDRLHRHRPWLPPTTAHDPVEAPELQLRRLLDEAVASTLPGQGNILCELTGGLDSTSVFTTLRAIQRPVEALTYVAPRGVAGDDELFAGEVIKQHPVPWHRLNMDVDEVILEDDVAFVPEPQGLLFAHQFRAIDACQRAVGADLMLTGAAGDVIFEFGGISPAFLADPVAARRPYRAWRLLRDWAHAKGGLRPWTHYLTNLALPIARQHRLGLSVLDWERPQPPCWLTDVLKRAHGLDCLEVPQLAPRVTEPGRQYLWESVYDLAAHENSGLYRRLPAAVRHPLYHRPLVELMLGLDFRIRRGWDGDRALQRRALADRLPEIVRERRSKGSAQELRERHLMESRRWHRAMTEAPRLVARGWVDPAPWREEVDRARVGASGLSAQFTNAIQAELWLQALERTGLPAPLQLTA
ncbi:MAG: asparagine synthase C-terminal domain-containing protein [Thiohalocapsa sp.]|nr:asparagine synthase C-terminal domain-containing protein [Thiohalocapsa sp.]